MHLSSKPPSDRVAVMSEIPPLSSKLSLGVNVSRRSWLLSSLPCHHPRLSVLASFPWVTLVCVHNGAFPPRRFSRLLQGPSLWHTGNHPRLAWRWAQLPQAHLPRDAAAPVLLFFSSAMTPSGVGNSGSHHCWRLHFAMNGTQALPALGSTLNRCGFYSCHEAQPRQWYVNRE